MIIVQLTDKQTLINEYVLNTFDMEARSLGPPYLQLQPNTNTHLHSPCLLYQHYFVSLVLNHHLTYYIFLFFI